MLSAGMHIMHCYFMTFSTNILPLNLYGYLYTKHTSIFTSDAATAFRKFHLKSIAKQYIIHFILNIHPSVCMCVCTTYVYIYSHWILAMTTWLTAPRLWTARCHSDEYCVCVFMWNCHCKWSSLQLVWKLGALTIWIFYNIRSRS